jgi:hypothetical protein
VSWRLPKPRWKVPPPEKKRAVMGLVSLDRRVPIRSLPARVKFPHDLYPRRSGNSRVYV